MKIHSLLENVTPSSTPDGNNPSSAPKFGRDPEVLEDELQETTTSGSVASVDAPVGSMQKRSKGSIFSGIKTSEKFPNSAPVKEEEIKEQDLIINPTLRKGPKPGFHKKDLLRQDHEVEMARSDLLSANKNSKKIYDLIKNLAEQDGLDGWVQEKIIKANDYLNTVREYLENKKVDHNKKLKEMAVGEGISTQELADAIYQRLESRFPDVVTRYGHEVVGDAILNVAEFHAGSDEIGTSDMSIIIREVMRQLNGLRNRNESTHEVDETKRLSTREKFKRSLKRAGYDPDAGADRLLNLIARQAEERKEFERKQKEQDDEFYGKQKGVAEGLFGISDKIKGKIQYITSELSDIPGYWDHQAQTFTEKGLDSLKRNLKRPEFIKYALSLTADDYDADLEEQVNTNESSVEQIEENLRNWFKEKWVRFGPDGKIRGDCARGDDSEGKPKCLPQSKAHALGKKGRASAGARKRREDPNPERSGKAINVATKKKSNEAVAEERLDEKCWDTHKQVGMKKKGNRMVPNCVPKESIEESKELCPECGGAMYSEEMINEKKDACYYKVKSRYKVWPSAYASGALVKCRNKGAKNWGNKSK